ncbi:MAG: hypothetical protein P9M03_09650, partial [Candidatus Theseobacter exili]|nr:hypothetical protein [Candidatus Theseobacter exili]
IPLFGKLFQKEKVSIRKKELVVFLTPRIISEKMFIPAEQKEKTINEKGEKKNEEKRSNRK